MVDQVVASLQLLRSRPGIVHAVLTARGAELVGRSGQADEPRVEPRVLEVPAKLHLGKSRVLEVPAKLHLGNLRRVQMSDRLRGAELLTTQNYQE